MVEPFERTTRYLTADSGRLALVGAALGLVVAMLWLAWLFFAQLPLYIHSQTAGATRDGAYIVRVDPAASIQLEPGQQVLFRPIGSDSELLPAGIVAVEPVAGLVQIELDNPGGEQPTGGEVWIVVDEVSPATLIIRAVEQTFAKP